MQRVCLYHAGCPDGFGAAWAVWRAWGEEARYLPCGHEDVIDARTYQGHHLVFADIAPANDTLRALVGTAAKLVVLDHHLSSQRRYEGDAELAQLVEAAGHQVTFDRTHSGAVLAWRHFATGEPVPELLAYIEDQDLWSWKLPHSERVNAAIASYPRRFEVWSDLSTRPISELAAEGEPILRANRIEVERTLTTAHRVIIDSRPVEAVNSTHQRSSLGHALALRARYGSGWGCVYRIQAGRVDVSLYSIGELDVSAIAGRYSGGGHRNAAGFSVPLQVWLDDFL
ncbi:MAG: hypothetical protein V3T33_09155 [Myxococcota bacterium]